MSNSNIKRFETITHNIYLISLMQENIDNDFEAETSREIIETLTNENTRLKGLLSAHNIIVF